MEINNIIDVKNRNEFREWLKTNHLKASECWIKNLTRGKPLNPNTFYYIDGVEEALCFGWIDSVYKKVGNSYYQRFTPRKKNSNWTVLNLARVERLKALGLMTKDGLNIVPKEKYVFDKNIMELIKQEGIFEKFICLPELYQKIRVNNMASIRADSEEKFLKSFKRFVAYTKEGKLIPGWDDYGRLS